MVRSASLPASKLGEVAIKAALQRANVPAGDVSEVILGQVLTAAQGQGPARQASVGAGIPVDSPAWSINQICGSGLRAVALGMQQIQTGGASIVVAGGQESMSQSTHAAHMRDGTKMGDIKLIDTMVKDGLWDAFNNYHMGTTAENVARQWQITREEQDKFAVASQNKAEAARKAGKFKDEIAPVTIKGRKGDTVVEQDEYIKDGVTYRRHRQAPSGIRSERGHRHRRQRFRHQRWRRRCRADDGRGSQEARDQAAGSHRLVGDDRRRSVDHGHRTDFGVEEGARKSRLVRSTISI